MSDFPHAFLSFRDEILLAEDDVLARRCRFEAFRGSGPGGQKRNKTSSKIRVVHPLSGLSAEAGEQREQSRNRAVALRRLRIEAALQMRLPADAARTALHDLPGWADVSPRGLTFPQIAARVLDVMESAGWVVREAADQLKISTGQLSKWLTADPAVHAHVNQNRQKLGLKPLRD